MNFFGGMNAVAQLHDDFLTQAFGLGVPSPGAWNVGSRPLCAAAAYSANYDDLGFGIR